MIQFSYHIEVFNVKPCNFFKFFVKLRYSDIQGGVLMNNLLSKQGLSGQELQLLGTEMDKKKKSTAAAWLLWFFLGGLGGHRYYLGKFKTGIAQTLTLGGLGIWALIDAFFINGMLRKENEKIESEIISQIVALRKTA